MRERFSFLKRWLGGSEPSTMLEVFTPRVVEQRGRFVRGVLAGATLVGAASLATIAAGSFALLFMALAGLYFLVTQVMGVELDLDPNAVMARAQEYARSAAPN